MWSRRGAGESRGGVDDQDKHAGETGEVRVTPHLVKMERGEVDAWMDG